MFMLRGLMVGSVFFAAMSAQDAFAEAPKGADSKYLDRGRYLVRSPVVTTVTRLVTLTQREGPRKAVVDR